MGDKIIRQVEPHDLLHFGFIPELIGRLPVVSTLDELSREAMLRILKEPRNALIKQYQRLPRMDGVDLVFEPAALDAVVDLAVKKKTGARALRSLMETAMLDVMFELPAMEGVVECRIGADVIRKHKKPGLKFAGQARRKASA